MGGLGIDLWMEGVTPNDLNDTDIGPSSLLNSPTLTSAIYCPDGLVVSGTYHGEAARQITVELFYSNGASLLSIDITTDASGNANYSATLPSSVPAGSSLVATATKTTVHSFLSGAEQQRLYFPYRNGTSELSTPIQTTSGFSIADLVVPEGDSGESLASVTVIRTGDLS